MAERTDRERALRAFCQWELGDTQWAEDILELLSVDDPLDWVRRVIGDDDYEAVMEDSNA